MPLHAEKDLGRSVWPYRTMWLAGGGIKGGLADGQTDEFGYYPVENRFNIRDLQATILRVLGFDPHAFHFAYRGLDQRLIGPTDEGKVLKEILS